MEQLNINSVVLDDKVLSVLKELQQEHESVSEMYIDQIETLIDYLIDTDTDNINALGMIRVLRMLKKDLTILSGR